MHHKDVHRTSARPLAARAVTLAATICLSSFGPAASRAAAAPVARPSGPAAGALRLVLGPEGREALGRRHPRSKARAAAADPPSPGPASELGAWETPFQIANYAIHAALLPTGKVLFWGYPAVDPATGVRPNAGQAVLWDPARGTGPESLSVNPPPLIPIAGQAVAAPLFCSGQSPLPDGELLITGGTLAYPNPATGGDWEGINAAFTFNPWTETWTRQPDMRQGRWYPTQTELPSGQVAVLSGYTQAAPGGVYNRDLEVFTPAASAGGVGTFVHELQGDRSTSLYPHLTLMPDGRELLLGPERDYGTHWDAGFLDPGTFTWNDSFPGLAEDRFGSNSVLVPSADPRGSQRVMVVGGASGDPARAQGSTVTFDAANPAAGPQADASGLNVPRWYANTVLLPDGSMATVGGGAGDNGDGTATAWYWTNGDPAGLRQVELWDPATGRWRPGPAQQHFRSYHSVALLLPDGRVLSAGDDYHQDIDGAQTAEIYDPPYLRRGASRPVINSAPGAVGYDAPFAVGSSSDVARAVLIAPGAVTHAVDMSQRYVRLRMTSSSGGTVQLVSPPSANAAPPGYYMLFLLDSAGVPSVARWIRLGSDLPSGASAVTLAAPPTGPSIAPGAAGGRTGVSAAAAAPRRSLAARLLGVRRSLALLRRRHSVTVRVRAWAAESVQVSVRLVAVTRAATRGGGASPPARVTRVFRAPGTAVLRVALGRVARRLLADAHGLRLEIAVVAREPGRVAAVSRITLAVRRP